MKIETERLYIRHFVNEDASICFEGWGTDEHLGDFIMGYPMNMDQMNSFVNAMVKNTNAWVIVEKESGACIGFFHMSWMGMEFKMSSFVPKEENGQRKILYTEIMEQQYEFQ